MKPVWISEFNGEVSKIEVIDKNIVIVGIKMAELIGEIYVYEQICS